MELKKMFNKGKQLCGKGKRKVMKVAVSLALLAMSAWAYVMPVFAVTNPIENVRTEVSGWLQSAVFIAMAVFGVLLLVKRRFTELLSFCGICIVAIALIWYPDKLQSFFGGIVSLMFG